MNKKILTAVLALTVTATSTIAQTKQLSAPSKTETVAPTNTETAPVKPTNNSETNSPLITPTSTQDVIPPDAVVKKFKSMYPEVLSLKWKMNKQSYYIAMFKNKVNESRTVFKADGSVIREMMVVPVSELPTAVSDHLTKNFTGKTPKRCELIKTESGKIVYTIKYEDRLIRLDDKGVEVKSMSEMD